MSFGISRGRLGESSAVPCVSVEVYPNKAGELSPEELGAAAGSVFAAAEAALVEDPYAKLDWQYTADKPWPNSARRVRHRLVAKASSDDVLERGPLHRARGVRVGNAMDAVLTAMFERYCSGGSHD